MEFQFLSYDKKVQSIHSENSKALFISRTLNEFRFRFDCSSSTDYAERQKLGYLATSELGLPET